MLSAEACAPTGYSKQPYLEAKQAQFRFETGNDERTRAEHKIAMSREHHEQQEVLAKVDFCMTVRLDQWFSTWRSRPPEGSWTIFGGVASRFFMYTAVVHLHYSSFRWGSLGYSELLQRVVVQKKLKITALDAIDNSNQCTKQRRETNKSSRREWAASTWDQKSNSTQCYNSLTAWHA